MSIEENISIILRLLADLPRGEGVDSSISGIELTDQLELSVNDINDAVEVSVDAGLVQWLQTLGTGPYNFREVRITPKGRYEIDRQYVVEEINARSEVVPPIRPSSPIGSPYGFSDEDWEIVTERKLDRDTLFVVLGYQFESDNYEVDLLEDNIRSMFEVALETYNNMPSSIPATLVFSSLAAGYGEHLFNQIARDIISSDISVFETSDMNPNVMIEMGVALTWGVRVLPIRATEQSIPPSDISGQTWVEYRNSGEEFVGDNHNEKVVRMVQRALRKK